MLRGILGVNKNKNSQVLVSRSNTSTQFEESATSQHPPNTYIFFLSIKLADAQLRANFMAVIRYPMCLIASKNVTSDVGMPAVHESTDTVNPPIRNMIRLVELDTSSSQCRFLPMATWTTFAMGP
ncbi:hypothetical protein F2Q69_00046878 [Brassica cretica]|uniref:Uncharacterized protein n=1 Tax=Brassica cretica TaxID=69181 RepID=A0A8S9PVP5_BRACR|nr:hypothetical protein F2Q69_00046878 [Brassica cretica]